VSARNDSEAKHSLETGPHRSRWNSTCRETRTRDWKCTMRLANGWACWPKA
jgi:hypothetical protein